MMTLQVTGIGARYGGCQSLEAFERAIYAGKPCSSGSPGRTYQAGWDAWQDHRGPKADRVRLLTNQEAFAEGIKADFPVPLAPSHTLENTPGVIFSALDTAAGWLEGHPRGAVLLVLGDERGAGAIILQGTSPGITQSCYAALQSLTTGKDPEKVCKVSLDQAGLSPSLAGWLEFIGDIEEAPETLRKLSGHFPLVDGERTTALGSLQNIVQDPTGMASLIKSLLALHRRVLFGSALEMNHPPQDLDHSGFYLPPQTRPWLDYPREIGRSALLCGPAGPEGAFGQLVLGESRHRRSLPDVRIDLHQQTTFLIPFFGEEQHGLIDNLADIEARLRADHTLGKIAGDAYAQLQAANRPAYTGALVGTSRDSLRQEIQRAQKDIPQALRTGESWNTPRGSCFTPRPLGAGGVAFVYPGAFNSYPGMGRELFNLFPFLHGGIEVLTTDISHSLAERFLYPRSLTPRSKADRAAHAERFFDHPVELIESGISLSVLHTLLLKDVFQIQPQAAFGYSLGEISMLWANDIWQNASENSAAWQQSPLFKNRLFGPKDAVRSYWNLESGAEQDDFWGSYIVKAPLELVEEALAQQPRAYLTIINAPGEAVIAGMDQACQKVIETLDCHALPMPFDAVIHNPAMRSTYDDFVDLYSNDVNPRSAIKFYSAADYQPLKLERDNLARQIASMTCKQVDFPRLVNAVYEDGARIFIEVGPQKTCSRWIDRILEGQPHAVIPINKKYQPDDVGVIKVLSTLLSHRVPMDLSSLYGSEGDQPADHMQPQPIPAPRRESIDQSQPEKQNAAGLEIPDKSPGQAAAPDQGQYAGHRHYHQAYQHLQRLSSRTTRSHQQYLQQQSSSLKDMTSLLHMKYELLSHGEVQTQTAASPLFDESQIQAFTLGDPRDCFGPSYDIFQGRRVPRLPNGPFRFIDRVLDIAGEMGEVEPGSSLRSEVDLPHDAWYFRNGQAELPVSCLMEAALQPCGFLSAYLGSTFHKPERDFYFRNLDGEGTLLSWPEVRGKQIRNRVELLSTSTLQDTIIQKYAFQLSCQGQAFYQGETSFGYFTPQALSNQVGLDKGKKVLPWMEHNPGRGFWSETTSSRSGAVDEGKPHLPHGKRIWISRRGGKHQAGYLYLEHEIDPAAWYFKAHFYQDPVMPGSLGVELLSQALQTASRALGLPADTTWRIQPGASTTWKYRGQVTRQDALVQVEVHIKEVKSADGKISILAEGSLWKDGLRIYKVDELALEGVHRV